MFNVTINIEENKIIGALVVDSYFFEPTKYDYAFYLYHNNEVVDTVWYSKQMEVVFDLKSLVGIFSVKAYIRDIEHGDKRSFHSEKISIES